MWPTIHLVRRVDIVAELLSKIKMPMGISDLLEVNQEKSTRTYPICGYILGVLTYTTAWNHRNQGSTKMSSVLL